MAAMRKVPLRTSGGFQAQRERGGEISFSSCRAVISTLRVSSESRALALVNPLKSLNGYVVFKSLIH